MSTAARRRKRGVHPLVIAAVAILATVFVIYYAFNQGLPFVHRHTVYAVVNNQRQCPCRLAGADRRDRRRCCAGRLA